MSTANRFRRLLVEQGALIAVLLLLLGAAALGGAWTVYQNPPTETVSEQRYRQQVASELDTSAIVTGNVSLYPNGTRLRNMPVYFFSITPNLTFSIETTVPADIPVNVTQRFFILQRATKDGKVFWDRREVLAATRKTVTDGNLTTRTTLNMSKFKTRLDIRRSLVGSVGTFTTEFVLNVTYDTGRYQGRLSSTAGFATTKNAYWLSGDMQVSRSHSTTVTRTVTKEPDPVVYGGLAGVGSLSILGALVVVVLRYRGVDPEEIETDLSHARYEEWISEGEFPTGTEKKYVQIETLEDLVDVAIDSNKRVVYDTEFNAYAVIDGDLIYYFSTNPERIDSWLDV